MRLGLAWQGLPSLSLNNLKEMLGAVEEEGVDGVDLRVFWGSREL